MIEVIGLTKRYGATVAVDGLSFTVRPGHVTGFLGPNGAGKTTTMSVILGLDAPTAGRATVNGRPFDAMRAPLREVGALLDARAVHGGRRARDHLLWLARSNGIGRRRVDEVLDVTGLTDVAGRRAGKFSLGMAQRLGIAAALLGDPGVLMFDEPVNGLDPEGIRWIRTLLRALASEGRTVLVSSHLMSEMALTADHLVVIGRGRLIADASMRDVVERGATRAVRVRTPEAERFAHVLVERGWKAEPGQDGALRVPGVDTRDVGELAALHGVVLHELAPERASLEEAFIELTDASVEFAGTTGGAAA
ncbi:MAG TPA: ATP-binding cassette domain-containing protein [Acidimicrobiia bacterium]|nr:ATP-binding cassette domain-containing protein [Acidimicrobiia bacterium]